MLDDITFVFRQFIPSNLFNVCTFCQQLRNTIDRIHDQMEPIQIIQHDHIKRGRCRSFFFVAANVQITVIRAAIGETIKKERLSVKNAVNFRLYQGREIEPGTKFKDLPPSRRTLINWRSIEWLDTSIADLHGAP